MKAIDPLQKSLAQPGTVAGSGTRKAVGASSAFDALLAATGKSGEALLPRAQQTAAELLRIEMMQQSLLLGGAEESAARTDLQALERLIPAAAETAAIQPGGAKGGAGAAPAADAGAEPVAAKAEVGLDGIDESAAHYLGTPYRFGGEGASGIDCSSLVQQVFAEHHIALPRTAREQRLAGQEVAPDELRKGDLVFFHTYASYPSHVGIYVGNGKMIHASSVKGEVAVSDINSEYYRSRFLGARRIG